VVIFRNQKGSASEDVWETLLCRRLWGRDSVVVVPAHYGLDGPGFQPCWWGKRLSSPHSPYGPWVLPSFLRIGHWGSFPGVKLSLTMTRTVPLFLLCVSTICYWVTFTFMDIYGVIRVETRLRSLQWMSCGSIPDFLSDISRALGPTQTTVQLADLSPEIKWLGREVSSFTSI
jgi:hypothetical protein